MTRKILVTLLAAVLAASTPAVLLAGGFERDDFKFNKFDKFDKFDRFDRFDNDFFFDDDPFDDFFFKKPGFRGFGFFDGFDFEDD